MTDSTPIISAHPRSVYKTSEFLGVVLVLLSIALQKLVPINIQSRVADTYLRNIICRPVGVLLVASSVFILRRTHKELAKYKQPHEPGIPTTRLITTGPFHYSRNPTYAAIVLLMQPGLGLIVGDAWMLLLLPASFLIFWYVMIRDEEKYLQKKFGEEWTAYCQRARRWI